ncbi:uncharacterized protein [Hetaerina americana]|uniref:uncharacterized protein isoform X2 n=1 Tax=Hetaerina americana TaxID=62018 RepID=UPI003A7F43B3
MEDVLFYGTDDIWLDNSNNLALEETTPILYPLNTSDLSELSDYYDGTHKSAARDPLSEKEELVGYEGEGSEMGMMLDMPMMPKTAEMFRWRLDVNEMSKSPSGALIHAQERKSRKHRVSIPSRILEGSGVGGGDVARKGFTIQKISLGVIREGLKSGISGFTKAEGDSSLVPLAKTKVTVPRSSAAGCSVSAVNHVVVGRSLAKVVPAVGVVGCSAGIQGKERAKVDAPGQVGKLPPPPQRNATARPEVNPVTPVPGWFPVKALGLDSWRAARHHHSLHRIPVRHRKRKYTYRPRVSKSSVATQAGSPGSSLKDAGESLDELLEATAQATSNADCCVFVGKTTSSAKKRKSGYRPRVAQATVATQAGSPGSSLKDAGECLNELLKATADATGNVDCCVILGKTTSSPKKAGTSGPLQVPAVALKVVKFETLVNQGLIRTVVPKEADRGGNAAQGPDGNAVTPEDSAGTSSTVERKEGTKVSEVQVGTQPAGPGSFQTKAGEIRGEVMKSATDATRNVDCCVIVGNPSSSAKKMGTSCPLQVPATALKFVKFETLVNQGLIRTMVPKEADKAGNSAQGQDPATPEEAAGTSSPVKKKTKPKLLSSSVVAPTILGVLPSSATAVFHPGVGFGTQGSKSCAGTIPEEGNATSTVDAKGTAKPEQHSGLQALVTRVISTLERGSNVALLSTDAQPGRSSGAANVHEGVVEGRKEGKGRRAVAVVPKEKRKPIKILPKVATESVGVPSADVGVVHAALPLPTGRLSGFILQPRAVPPCTTRNDAKDKVSGNVPIGAPEGTTLMLVPSACAPSGKNGDGGKAGETRSSSGNQTCTASTVDPNGVPLKSPGQPQIKVIMQPPLSLVQAPTGKAPVLGEPTKPPDGAGTLNCVSEGGGRQLIGYLFGVGKKSSKAPDVVLSSEESDQKGTKRQRKRRLKEDEVDLEGKRLRCGVCDLVLPSMDLMDEHQLGHMRLHWHWCLHCWERFKHKNELQFHMYGHLGLIPPRSLLTQTCNLCGTAVLRRNFAMHQLVHNRERSFVCVECGKSFRTKEHLKSHGLSHGDVRPFECAVCAKRFKRKSALRTHQLTHSNMAPRFACDHCGRAFPTTTRRRLHMVSHSTERNFACPICGKAFKTHCQMQQHAKRHVDLPQFKCQSCDQRFRDRVGLRKHQERLHHH